MPLTPTLIFALVLALALALALNLALALALGLVLALALGLVLALARTLALTQAGSLCSAVEAVYQFRARGQVRYGHTGGCAGRRGEDAKPPQAQP